MIAATYNCGCPIPRQLSLIAEPIESQLSGSQSPFQPSCSIVSGDETQTAITCSSREILSEEYASSNSYLKLKELKSKQCLPDKIVSEIVRKGQPYKEIEALINDNRVIIRMHKEPVKEEYDPPCECVGQDVTVKESTSSLKKCDDGISFGMANGSLELCRTPREDASAAEKSSCEKKADCRTMTLYPEADESSKPRVENPIALEENPNIFILRIRKRCESGDKKHKIDFEFRAPRPWRSKKHEIGTVK